MNAGKTEGNIKGPRVKLEGYIDAMLEGANIIMKLQIEEELTKICYRSITFIWMLHWSGCDI